MTAQRAHGVPTRAVAVRDEISTVAGTRALRLVRPASRLPGADPTVDAPDLARGGDPTGIGRDDALDHDEVPTPVDLGCLPNPRTWAALLAQAVVEVLAARRPVGQVVRWVDPEIAERLRASAPVHARAGRPVRVRRVRVSTHLNGTVEAVVVVDDGARCRALAMRLEALSRRWLCTALDLV